MDELKGDDKEELIELLDCHFDPEKQAVFPLVKKHRSKRGGKCRAILFSNIVTIVKPFFFSNIRIQRTQRKYETKTKYTRFTGLDK